MSDERPDLFDAAAEARATSEAIGQAWVAADDEWRFLALEIIERVARVRPTLTSDDVWEAGLPAVEEPRALGGAFRIAQSRGLIRSTTEMGRSRKKGAHGHPTRVWRSLVFDGSEPVPPAPRERMHETCVRMPVDLLAEVDAEVARANLERVRSCLPAVSRNEWVRLAIAEYLDRRSLVG